MIEKMERYLAKQHNEYMSGTWKGVRLSSGKRGASFTCPNCRQTASLIDHEISDNGDVNPSVVCPDNICGFHRYIKLLDWNPVIN